MGLTVNTNLAALNAYRNLSTTQSSLSSSLEKLSSGYRINRAADDAAGLAISQGLQSQIGGLTQAARNAQDGINVVQTAEGAMTEVHSILQRLNDLAVQAANDSNDTNARADIQTEADGLTSELTRISSATKFNGKVLLDGSAGTMNFQVGADSSASSTISVDLSGADVSASGLAVNALKFDSNTDAQTSLTSIQTAIQTVSTARANLGASQNRLQHTINSVNVTVENLTASKSQIQDTDMASEMVNFTRNQILSQAGTAMLAQANSMPQSILKLLG
ncbi:MAG: flagellin [Cellulomonas sp.]|uniref:flagellin N-terminal helical domain-containing protein n=1 Tax=Cellulomonas sp. 73-92 TaxID=1895740 RepID=UPI0009295412|nr:flagellin [Cellulomonas sp. 73-92]MBN9375689.1 flagellin [Cellulomonas sp.]OJV80712.1 MAG: flagellin [Cellulomonas sp. 73-92]